MIRAHINKVKFKSGLEVSLTKDSILVLLGPNNSGKSVSLADIRGLLSGHSGPAISLESVFLHRESTIEEIKDFIGPPQDEHGQYNLPGYNFHVSHLDGWWKPEKKEVGPFLTDQLISNLTTKLRLSDCDPPPSLDFRSKMVAIHPFQHMYRDPELEQRTSAVIRIAFKQDLVLHRSAGKLLPVYVGIRPKNRRGEPRESLAYSKRVEALDQLETQGDGIRSFVSIIARVLTEDRAIQLIDEPEAFLHPPQARLVAENVAAHGGGRQTFVATHSSDILQGLLSGHSSRVSVVRLTRHAGKATASYLPSDQISALWRDPILRFSRVLDGLFHEGVIITEADADCRFYEAIANATVPPEDRPDLHYSYSGGKDRLPSVIASLMGLKVPIASIVDADVLNNIQPLRRIVEAHGGAWSTVEDDWAAVKRAVEAKATFVGADEFRREMTKLIKSIPAGTSVPKETLSRIKSLARRASPWDNVKDTGLDAIAKGEPTVIARRLLKSLRSIGVFVVPMGEMEGFYRTINVHGPRWVEEVLKLDLKSNPDLEQARQFIGQVVKFLHEKQA